jgi:hypothetical protein
LPLAHACGREQEGKALCSRGAHICQAVAAHASTTSKACTACKQGNAWRRPACLSLVPSPLPVAERQSALGVSAVHRAKSREEEML